MRACRKGQDERQVDYHIWNKHFGFSLPGKRDATFCQGACGCGSDFFKSPTSAASSRPAVNKEDAPPPPHAPLPADKLRLLIDLLCLSSPRHQFISLGTGWEPDSKTANVRRIFPLDIPISFSWNISAFLYQLAGVAAAIIINCFG